jgi:hypothetical protein
MIVIQLYAILERDKKMNNLQLQQKDRQKEIDCLLEFRLRKAASARN